MTTIYLLIVGTIICYREGSFTTVLCRAEVEHDGQVPGKKQTGSSKHMHCKCFVCCSALLVKLLKPQPFFYTFSFKRREQKLCLVPIRITRNKNTTWHIPARDLCESRHVSCQACVCTGGLWVGGAAVVVSAAEISALITTHLQRFTQLHQWRGQTCQADNS